jgi:hypothetical protein
MLKILSRSLSLGLAIILLTLPMVGAQNPGTASDPLVSKSYVDHFLKFRTLMLSANTTLKLPAGAMLIVRSGQLRLEAPKGKNLIDLTAGREVPAGGDLPHNHLLIVPDNADYVVKARKESMILAAQLSEDPNP